MKSLNVSYNNFELSIQGPKGEERIKINNNYPNTSLSQFIFSNLGLMYLISPYFPRKIFTNFEIAPQIKKLIGAMYQSENHQSPLFNNVSNNPCFVLAKTDSNRAVVAYSGGKDSLWNLWWAQKKYGANNVLAVHINGLNKCSASHELKYTKRQQKEIGFNLKIIDLLNTSRLPGLQNMRSRDMFLAGIIIPLAIEFGASKIITEGFFETDPREAFTGREENMKYFNKILRLLRVPVQVSWRNDTTEMDAIKDLIKNRPRWLAHVCNCFTIPNYKVFLRKSWQRRAPTLPLYKAQCGSCIKCRAIILSKILHDPIMKKVRKKDIQTYLENTVYWIRKNRAEFSSDMPEVSFLKYFKKALRKYGLKKLESRAL